MELVLEKNKYDDKAVSVKFNGTHIGYLPRGSAIQEEVFDDLSSHRRVEATVVDYSYYDEVKRFNTEHLGVLKSVSIDVDAHLGYQRNGKDYDSITRLLGTGQFGDKARLEEWMCSWGSYKKYRAALMATAENGTKMHKIAENCLKAYRDGTEMPDYPPVVNFLNKYKPEILGVETVVFDDDLMIAGTYDGMIRLTVKMGGKKVVIDWKTSKAVQLKHKLQGSWYGVVEDADEAWVVLLDSKTKQRYSVTKIGREEMKNNYEIVRHLSDIQKLLPKQYKLT